MASPVNTFPAISTSFSASGALLISFAPPQPETWFCLVPHHICSTDIPLPYRLFYAFRAMLSIQCIEVSFLPLSVVLSHQFFDFIHILSYKPSPAGRCFHLAFSAFSILANRPILADSSFPNPLFWLAYLRRITWTAEYSSTIPPNCIVFRAPYAYPAICADDHTHCLCRKSLPPRLSLDPSRPCSTPFHDPPRFLLALTCNFTEKDPIFYFLSSNFAKTILTIPQRGVPVKTASNQAA